MFVKVTSSGPRRYVQLVESNRDDAGRVKKRTVATLGRLDQLSGELDTVINGLLKVAGREAAIAQVGAASALAAPPLSFEAARALGNVWTLTELWKELGFSDLRRVFGRTRHTIDVEALIRIMVLNRLCDPDSKLGMLRWLQAVALPDVEIQESASGLEESVKSRGQVLHCNARRPTLRVSGMMRMLGSTPGVAGVIAGVRSCIATPPRLVRHPCGAQCQVLPVASNRSTASRAVMIGMPA